LTKGERGALATVPLAVLVGAGVAWACSVGGAAVGGMPVVVLCATLAYVVQWLAFVLAYVRQTERFYDLTGSATYMTVAAVAVALAPQVDARSILLLALILVWAARLGSYLVMRIHRAGRDERFDQIKSSFPRFLSAWTLQALWIVLTLAAALAAITTTVREPLGGVEVVGAVVWLLGFGLEVIADLQKSRFRADPGNRGRFISTGLWRWSRHPNYFGEIMLWIGVAIVAAPVLRGWQWVGLISPLFVILLLTRVSGVPMLEKRADARWGGQEDYESYKSRTSVLIPLPPGKRRDGQGTVKSR